MPSKPDEECLDSERVSNEWSGTSNGWTTGTIQRVVLCGGWTNLAITPRQSIGSNWCGSGWTIALVAALVIGEFVTASMITVFVLTAEVLEGLTVGRGRRAIRDLLDFLPGTATVRRSAVPIRIPLSEVRAGDIVLVAPGECVDVDGLVRGGHSYADQATITGEPTPRREGTGRGGLRWNNQSGTLEIVADRNCRVAAPITTLNVANIDVFAQDSVKLSDRTTWSLGLRAAWITNPSSPSGGLARLNAPFDQISHDANQPMSAVMTAGQSQVLNARPGEVWINGGGPQFASLVPGVPLYAYGPPSPASPVSPARKSGLAP